MGNSENRRTANKWLNVPIVVAVIRLLCANHLSGTAWRTVEISQEGRLMGWMNKFTLIEQLPLRFGGKDYSQARYLLYLMGNFQKLM